ncbi:MAG: hypothetical protein AABX34_04555, partial [Nanoarchaeota archaeon]
MTILEALEGIEIRELRSEELNVLQGIIDTKNWNNIKYIYMGGFKDYTVPWVAPFIKPKETFGDFNYTDCAITIVALGHKGWSQSYPLLYFSGKTLLGYFSVRFFNDTKLG